jgi:hypothetical protein
MRPRLTVLASPSQQPSTRIISMCVGCGGFFARVGRLCVTNPAPESFCRCPGVSGRLSNPVWDLADATNQVTVWGTTVRLTSEPVITWENKEHTC